MEITKVVVELTEVGCMMAASYGLRTLETYLKQRERQKLSQGEE